MADLQKLFDDNKDTYGYGKQQQLVIAEAHTHKKPHTN